MGSELTVQTANRSGTAVSFQSLGGTAAADADYFTNTAHEMMYITSSGGGTVYTIRTRAVDGQTPADKAYIIPDATTIRLGPFPVEDYSSTMQVYIAAGGTVTAGIIRV